MDAEIEQLIEDARFDFTMDDYAEALEKLDRVIAQDAGCFDAWHTKSEIHYAQKQYAEALEAAQKAHAICPDDLHINTSLSRIWLECGSKEQAEHFGAKARMLGWKDQLKQAPGEE